MVKEIGRKNNGMGKRWRSLVFWKIEFDVFGWEFGRVRSLVGREIEREKKKTRNVILKLRNRWQSRVDLNSCDLIGFET